MRLLLDIANETKIVLSLHSRQHLRKVIPRLGTTFEWKDRSVSNVSVTAVKLASKEHHREWQSNNRAQNDKRNA